MRYVLKCCAAVIAVLVAGCGGTGASAPTSPSATVIREAPPAARGTIGVAAISHTSGSTLIVDDCGPSWSGIPGHHVCTDDWAGTFNVVVDRAVTNAAITVTFEGDSGRCGMITVGGLSFAASQTRRVITSSAVYMTHEPEGYANLAVTQDCSLPATTDRLVVQLWDRDGGPGSGRTPVLRAEFDYRYSFVSEQ